MNLKNKTIRILTILWILFIFSNSLIVGKTSGNISGHFSAILLSWINNAGFFIEEQLFHHYIRKTAHFTEYAVLGALAAAAVSHEVSEHRKTFFISLWILIPAVDETIQLFVPGRSGAVKDCLIDMSGYITGAFCMYVLLLIVRDLFRLKRHQ